jgi:hypothetical protein
MCQKRHRKRLIHFLLLILLGGGFLCSVSLSSTADVDDGRYPSILLQSDGEIVVSFFPFSFSKPLDRLLMLGGMARHTLAFAALSCAGFCLAVVIPTFGPTCQLLFTRTEGHVWHASLLCPHSLSLSLHPLYSPIPLPSLPTRLSTRLFLSTPKILLAPIHFTVLRTSTPVI